MLPSIVLAGLTLFVGLTQTGINDSTRVVGRVMSGSHVRPVSNAVVVATSDSEVAETNTDSHGRFELMTLLPGIYQLTALAGCEGDIYGVSGESNFVELSAGVEYLANLDVAMRCR